MVKFMNLRWFDPERDRQEALFKFLERKKLNLNDFNTKAHNYTCAFPSLAAQISDCTSNIDTYFNHVQTTKYKSRPYNILIIAPPGAGKSTLAKSLALELLKNISVHNMQPEDEIIKTQYDQFNLTRLETSEDLDELLLNISSKAEDSKKKGSLSFFLLDECDSFFKFPFFQRVIMPIWDGNFFERYGAEIQIPSCVLFFVMSKMPKIRMMESMSYIYKGVKKNKSINFLLRNQGIYEFWREDTLNYCEHFLTRFPKGEDFLSRMVDIITIPPLFDPVRDEWVKNQPNLSSRYLDVIALSARFITNRFKVVNKIQKALLYYLAVGLGSIQSIRDLDNLFFKSSPPKYGKFSYEQLPKSERDRFEKVVKKIPISLSAYLTIYE